MKTLNIYFLKISNTRMPVKKNNYINMDGN